MIKKLLTGSLMLCLIGEFKSQCATSSAPTNNCTYGDQINSFVLNGISAVGNAGCGTSGYNSFTSPVWNLVAGTNYTWAATVGSGSYNQGVAIWIDYNNDGFFAATEQVAVSPSSQSHLGNFTIPVTATGGNVKMRVRCAYNNNSIANTDACTNNLSSFGETEDYDVVVVPPPPCNGTPASNVVVVPSFSICPNSGINVSLATSYTETGITYQWQSSTVSAVGLWSSISSGTNATLATGNLTVNTWYQVIVTCANTTQSITSTGLVSVSPIIVDDVPYHEGFEGITGNNQLPNCSWSASNLPTINQTYVVSNTNNRLPHTGNNFASFRYGTNTSGDYFYSNGVNLKAGVTYSAGTWYITDGYSGWSEFSLSYGTSQSSTGLTAIASKTGAVVGQFYQLLSNTFTVPADGVYYMAIKCVGNFSPAFLTFDDLFVVVPCGPNSPNTPSLSLGTPVTTICEGETVNLNASGADTYTWNTGSNASSISDVPTGGSNAMYVVMGTNTLSGCSSTLTQNVLVKTAPPVNLAANSLSVCSGSPVLLSAFGAQSYTWSTGSNLSDIVVSPTAATTYSVLGTGMNGCVGTSARTIGVYALPTINATSSSPVMICEGEEVTLTANGSATSFQWVSSASPVILGGNPINVTPALVTTYTVTGTDVNGCTNKSTVVQNVEICLGLHDVKTSSGTKIYPNPTAGLFTVELNSSELKTIQVIDFTGRVILTQSSNDEKMDININGLANGIYYVKIQTEAGVELVKIIKQ
jgi:hypothetical protein